MGGSGGGRYKGGTGGGYIEIELVEELILDGTLSANGEDG